MPRNRSEKIHPHTQAMLDFRDAAIAQYEEWGIAPSTPWAEAMKLGKKHGSSAHRERAIAAWAVMAAYDRAVISSYDGLEGALAYIKGNAG